MTTTATKTRTTEIRDGYKLETIPMQGGVWRVNLIDNETNRFLSARKDLDWSRVEEIKNLLIAGESAKRCDFFGCANPARPGSEDCATHQHAVSCESSNGTQITLTCACGDTFGPVGEPNDRRLQNRDDALSLHAKHAAIA